MDGYSNGNGNGFLRNGNNAYDYDHEYNDRNASPAPDQQAEGYGGLDSPTQHGQTRSLRAQSLRSGPNYGSMAGGGRAYGRMEDRPVTRSGRAEGPAAKQIQDVLWSIKQDWNFMTEDKCVPIKVTLQLMDESSLGLASRYDEFQDTQEQLQTALRGIVNEHHQGFNSSIGTFHQIQASIQSSHDRVRALKARLIDAKTNLTTTKSEFQSLVTSSRSYDGMVDILSTIEQIKQVPEQLEAKISDKRFLSAVDCLQEGLRLIRSSEMASIGALSEIKLYLSNQEHALTNILTEELHNHLYLKSPYCEERWTAYAKLHQRNGHADALESSSRPLHTFLDGIDTSVPLVEDTYRNPEVDSFQYIYTIVEALNKLGCLEAAVEAVEERLPVELFKVVNRTNSDVQQRHPSTTKAAFNVLKSPNNLLDDHERKGVLEELLATLYGRFEAIAESHRAFHDVIAGVAKREGAYDRPLVTRSFRELWKLYQSEIRSILHDYLSTDGGATLRSGQGMANEGNVFRHQRDRNKKCLFKMDFVDPNVPEVKQEREEIIALWQKFVPGLVSLPQGPTAAATPSQNDNSATGHSLLAEPSVFNITALLPPSVFFLKRLRELVPSGADIPVSTLTSFLNDFLINVFHPQLEETLTEYCSRSYLALDAFHEDPQWTRHAQKPIFRGSVIFFDTITAFCRTLDDLTHDQLFTQLVIEQMHTYYDRCNAWYKALVTRSQAKPDGSRTSKAAASFAESGRVHDAIVSLYQGEDKNNDRALVNEETQALLSETSQKPLDESDLILDRKTQGALCLLFTSTKWMALKLASLRHISDRATDSRAMDMDDFEDRPTRQRSLTTSLPSHQDVNQDAQVYLPMSEGTASLFDGIVDGFRELAETVLRTIRLELRCEILQGLATTFHGDFIYAESADVPNENTLKLVSQMLDFNTQVSTLLQPDEYNFITSGLVPFLDTALVSTIHNKITVLNLHGTSHLQMNTRVLYHNILSLDPHADFPRVSAYLRLFRHGPDAIVAAGAGGSAGVPPGTFEKQELRRLLELRYSEPRRDEDEDEAMKAEEGLKIKVAQLEEIVGRGVGVP